MAYEFAKHHGIVEEDKYPYKMERGDCECPPRDAVSVTVGIKSHHLYGLFEQGRCIDIRRN